MILKNWLTSWQLLPEDVVILVPILVLGVLSWLLNIGLRLALSRSQLKSRINVVRFVKQLGGGAIWFIFLILLDSYYPTSSEEHRWIVLAQTLVGIVLVIRLVSMFVPARNLARLIIFTVIPLMILNTLGVLEQAISTLERYQLVLGNIQLSLYDVLRVAYFGILLFWFGRISNRLGKQKIREQKNLDKVTKEVVAKLFEVGVFILIFLVLLNILGINLTTLAVIGGAVGVGIGFGLQSIASNFISGLIILLDRSLTIGDYIELEDGRSGLIRELNLRAVTLETFDGKDIVVPNDVFFTESFTNWTHKNQRQRYAIEFSVAYSTDLDRMFPLVKEMLRQHPLVLSGDQYEFEEQPDIEISGFGDNGIDLLIEFWMEAIDDGKHRVGGDLMYELWKLMNAEGFEFPFPQREVRLLKDQDR